MDDLDAELAATEVGAFADADGEATFEEVETAALADEVEEDEARARDTK